jgi:hypothetical protein
LAVNNLARDFAAGLISGQKLKPGTIDQGKSIGLLSSNTGGVDIDIKEHHKLK